MKTKKWFATLGIGILGNWTIDWAFNFLLYPFIIYEYGILLGGVIMTILSFFICYGIIRFYDWSKKDWLGIETLKEIEDFRPRPIPSNGIFKYIFLVMNMVGNFSAQIMKKSDALLLFLLSVKFDPFVTVIHIRHGAHQYNGLSKRDWKIFISSLIIGDIYWTVVVYTGITIIGAFWHLIARIINLT